MARALFAEGRELAAQGNYAQACPKFEESLRLDPGIGTQFNLADCWEHTGRITSAWALFLDTAAAAQAAVQPERAEVARARAKALEPSLPRLVLHVATSPAPAQVTLDGVLIGKPSWGTPIPVDPGQHTVAWRQSTGATGEQRLEVALGERQQVEVPARATKATPPAASAAIGITPEGPPPDTQHAPNDGTSQQTWALALGAVGVVGLGVGTGYTFAFHKANGAAEAICPARVECAPGDEARWRGHVADAESARRTMVIGFGVGTLAAAGAAILYWTADPAPAVETLGTARFRPNVTADLRSVGVELSGQW